jgi:fructose 1,6-bisphosphatase
LIAQERVHDLVRFQMNGQMRNMPGADRDAIHNLAMRSAEDATAIASRVYEVAGRVLADSLSIEMESIGHGQDAKNASKKRKAALQGKNRGMRKE